MKSTDIFPGKYLRADDLKGTEPTVIIKAIKIETLGDDSKPVLYFQGKDKGLVMNKTNWNAVVDITGEDDSDDWTGCKVKLVTRKVDFQGKRVNAIRIEETNGATRQAAPPPADDADGPDRDDYDVGF